MGAGTRGCRAANARPAPTQAVRRRKPLPGARPRGLRLATAAAPHTLSRLLRCCHKRARVPGSAGSTQRQPDKGETASNEASAECQTWVHPHLLKALRHVLKGRWDARAGRRAHSELCERVDHRQHPRRRRRTAAAPGSGGRLLIFYGSQRCHTVSANLRRAAHSAAFAFWRPLRGRPSQTQGALPAVQIHCPDAMRLAGSPAVVGALAAASALFGAALALFVV